MTNRELTATRTMLANAMATAGAELLEYMGTAGALAAIPNTDPPRYVVAGTLPIIAKLLPTADTAPAVQAPSQVPPELSEERIDSIAKPFAGMGGVEDYRSFARAVERELRAGSRCAQPELGQLHNAIMNLAALAPYDRVRHESEYKAYMIGHRDARHAAAELVNGAELCAGSSDVPEQAPQWISVGERLPEKYCLAAYVTSNGKYRIIRAMYVKRFSIEVTEDGDTYSEYREEDDKEYLREGWYECIDNWGEYSSCFVNEGVVTHWMPLPAAPAASKEGGEHV